ncbi:MAG: VOC family protein, partial [Polyangiaceae bacterium]
MTSIVSHVSLGTNDFDRAAAFYDRVLTTLGAKRILEHPGAIGYGKMYPEIWIQTPIDGNSASVGNGTHVAFLADSPDQVRAFYEAAV